MLGISFTGRCKRTPFIISLLVTLFVLALCCSITFSYISATIKIVQQEIVDEIERDAAEVARKAEQDALKVNNQNVQQVSPDEFNKILKGEEATPEKIKQDKINTAKAKMAEKYPPIINLIFNAVNQSLNQYEIDEVTSFMYSLTYEQLQYTFVVINILLLYIFIFQISYWIKRGHDFGMKAMLSLALLSPFPIGILVAYNFYIANFKLFFYSSIAIPVLALLYYLIVDGDVDFNDYDE